MTAEERERAHLQTLADALGVTVEDVRHQASALEHACGSSRQVRTSAAARAVRYWAAVKTANAQRRKVLRTLRKNTVRRLRPSKPRKPRGKGDPMKRMLFVLGAVLMFCFVPRVTLAQSITSWTLKISNVGAAAPLSTTVLQSGNVVCNQAPPPLSATANPMKVVFDDVTVAGKVCIWTDPGTGPLFSVPFGGNYQGTLAATNSAGTSAESAVALFTRPGAVPAVPTGVRIGS